MSVKRNTILAAIVVVGASGWLASAAVAGSTTSTVTAKEGVAEGGDSQSGEQATANDSSFQQGNSGTNEDGAANDLQQGSGETGTANDDHGNAGTQEDGTVDQGDQTSTGANGAAGANN